MIWFTAQSYNPEETFCSIYICLSSNCVKVKIDKLVQTWQGGLDQLCNGVEVMSRVTLSRYIDGSRAVCRISLILIGSQMK